MNKRLTVQTVLVVDNFLKAVKEPFQSDQLPMQCILQLSPGMVTQDAMHYLKQQ